MSAEYIKVADLPSYTVCTLEELVARQEAASNLLNERKIRDHQGEPSGSASQQTTQHDYFPCTPQPGRYRFNECGRLILVTAEDREIVVYAHKKIGEESAIGTNLQQQFEVFAYDRNCYHVGYPMDMGDIEDLPVAVCVARKGAGSAGGSAATATEEFNVVCVNCPLHNRIFDLKTGDLVIVDHSQSRERRCPVDGNVPLGVGEVVVPHGKRKGGRPSAQGCFQRVHPVVCHATSTGVQIVVFDTFGGKGGNAMNPPPQSNGGSDELSRADVRERRIELGAKIQSDKYNPEGALTDFAEFDPKKGNSFVEFRPPSQQRTSAELEIEGSVGGAQEVRDIQEPIDQVQESGENLVKNAAPHDKCCDMQ